MEGMVVFKSGRTEGQGMRPFVIEGGKLYVSPKRFALAKAELAHPAHQDDYHAEHKMLRTLGFLDAEIQEFERGKHPGFEIVVDYELEA